MALAAGVPVLSKRSTTCLNSRRETVLLAWLPSTSFATSDPIVGKTLGTLLANWVHALMDRSAIKDHWFIRFTETENHMNQ